MTRVLHIDNRAAFWTRMSRNYRYRYEALQRDAAWEMRDVMDPIASIDTQDRDVLVVGVFGTPLHPQFPTGPELPLAVLSRFEKRCLVLEDMHEHTYLGGIEALSRHINDHFPYLIATYDCEELDRICKACPHLRKVFLLPHHIDTAIFRDYGLEKEWDFLLYGILYDPWYPFRKRLHRLITRNFRRVKTVKHPGYQSLAPAKCGAALARLINQSRIAVATPLICDYFVAKYFEISACRCVVAGKMATQGRAIWGDNYISLEESMTDEEILSTLRRALGDTQRLEAMADAMYDRIQADFSLRSYVNRFNSIVHEIAAD